MISRALPIVRTGEAIVGGVFTLIAAIGIWQRKKWGMVLALVASVVSIVIGAATLLLPVAGPRCPGLHDLPDLRDSAELAGRGGLRHRRDHGGAGAAAPSMKGYIVAPKERRVM